MKIAYIGLGNMGLPMVVNLVRAQCNVGVYDIEQAKIDEAVKAGAVAATDAITLVQQCDILFTSLPQPKHVASVLPPLLKAMPAGSIWVDLTTNDRDLVLSLAKQANEREISVVEAPLTGAVDGARLGKLTFFVGGNHHAIEAVRPYLEIMGKPIICGALGCGNVVKLVTNQMWFINAAAIGEALVLGKKSGVELSVLWDALKNSVGDSFVTRHDVPSIFDGHYDPSFSLGLCCKDLRLLQQLGEQTQTSMDITKLAQQKFEQAEQQFGGNAAELLVCKLVEEASNTDLRLEGDWQKHWEV